MGRQRAEGEHGAVIVETARAVPLLGLLVSGIVSFGVIVGDRQDLTQASILRGLGVSLAGADLAALGPVFGSPVLAR